MVNNKFQKIKCSCIKQPYMIHIVTVSIIISLLTGCNIRHAQRIPASPNDNKTYKTELIDATDNIPYYRCDEYVPFDTEPDTKNIEDMFPVALKCSKEPFVNVHDKKITDTIYTYTYRDNRIAIYKSRYKDLLAIFDVTDKRFEINGGLAPGISKEYFLKKFSIKNLVADTVDIGNMEHTDVTRFYFENNELVRIKIEPYLD